MMDCGMLPAMKPLVLDLFCGLGGWSEAFIAQGYRAVGFDVEKHDYGTGGYPGELVLRDVRSLTGSDLVKEYGVPACIVASPPCQVCFEMMIGLKFMVLLRLGISSSCFISCL